MTKNKITKCLFPAAGYGTRFLPVTKAIPKEMLSILTKPLIQYGIEEAKTAGINTMAIFTSKYKKAIEDHFDTHADIQNSISGSESKEALLKPLSNIIENNLYKVNDMVEKPEPQDAPSNLAIIGRYILIPEIFDIIRDTKPGKGGEIQITDALLTLAKQGKVLAYKFEGKRFDCGSIDGFVGATNHFYNKELN